MEFNEMKKIWDIQNSEQLYAINETALHNVISSKKNKSLHIVNISELLLIVVNLAAGFFVLAIQPESIALNLMCGWMFLTSICILIARFNRIRSEGHFDRSMLGELEHAVASASYQVRFSGLLRWNIIPTSVFILAGFWEMGKPFWIAAVFIVFMIVTHFASGWEHGIYKSRRTELEKLRRKLVTPEH